jgi:hypothetical protein
MTRQHHPRCTTLHNAERSHCTFGPLDTRPPRVSELGVWLLAFVVLCLTAGAFALVVVGAATLLGWL